MISNQKALGPDRFGPQFFVGGSGPAAPAIAGFAYPGNTLTSTQTGQWHVGGVDVSGQTGTTFAPRLEDIGSVIGQTNENGTSNTLTCWHPRDVPAVKSCRVAFAGVLNSVGPDIPATVGQTCRRWADIINGYPADQVTGANQPILREVSGVRYLESDGVNDFMTGASAGESSILSAVPSALSIVAIASRTTPANSYQGIMTWYDGALDRPGFYHRWNDRDSSAAFSCRTALDTYLESFITTPFVSAPRLMEIRDYYSSGYFEFWQNSVLIGAKNYQAGAGLSESAPSTLNLFSGNNVGQVGPIDFYCQITATGNPTAAELSRLRRFAMLCMGSNYSGPDIPLIDP